MQCPVCKTVGLVTHNLEADLPVMQCPSCGGHWLKSYYYWRWLKQYGQETPEKSAEEGLDLPVTESYNVKVCPECGHILFRYRVGHALNFSLDRCGYCGGTWFDKNEWEILKSRNLHDDIHFIFSQPWQAEITRQERQGRQRQRVQEQFSKQDLAEIRRIKAWIDQHPRKAEVIALLLKSES